MSSIFISYSHNDDDTDVVERLSRDLHANGIDVWVDRDQIRLGDNWEASIHRAIRDAGEIIIVVSETAHESWWIRHEIKLGRTFEKSLIPLLLPGGEQAMEILDLQEYQIIDARSNYDEAIAKIIQSTKLEA